MPLQASVVNPEQKYQNIFQCTVNPTQPPSRKCRRCIGHKRNGQRCKLRTCYDWNYCWLHLQKLFHVRIAESTIKIQGRSIGLGLFARTNRSLPTALLGRLRTNRGRSEEKRQYLVFKKNDVIGHYFGENLTKAQLDQRYDYQDNQGEMKEQVAPYAVTSEDGTIMDALCKRNFMAYANDPLNSHLRANSIMNENTKILRASRNIWEGEEIVWKYGADYWNFPIAKIKTQMRR